MSKKNFICTFFCLLHILCSAQPFGDVTHFSHDMKLSQSRIQDIKQDKKGFIWLGTFNGLIRYDGSSFRNFRVGQIGSLNLISNRIPDSSFDRNGRIWIKSDKNDIYYFDTYTYSFHYPLESDSKSTPKVLFKDYQLMSSGRV